MFFTMSLVGSLMVFVLLLAFSPFKDFVPIIISKIASILSIEDTNVSMGTSQALNIISFIWFVFFTILEAIKKLTHIDVAKILTYVLIVSVVGGSTYLYFKAETEVPVIILIFYPLVGTLMYFYFSKLIDKVQSKFE